MRQGQSSKLVSPRPLAWGVVGGSGFVGTGIVHALQEIPTSQVHTIAAPRLTTPPTEDVASLCDDFRTDAVVRKAVADLVKFFRGLDVVVNAAGLAAPDSLATKELFGANALLPTVIAEAAKQANVKSFLHISSAAVQGPKSILDETGYVQPFSPYSQSKAAGEQALVLWRKLQGEDGPLQNTPTVTVIRATSVQGLGRGTSQALHRIASSRLASVAAPGTQPTVVSSREELSRFIVKMGCYDGSLPPVLLQPWEGASVKQVLELAGNGRSPVVLPRLLARSGVVLLQTLGKLHPRLKGLSRRLEVMWFGQEQVPGWAVDEGVVESSGNNPSESLRKTLSGTK